MNLWKQLARQFKVFGLCLVLLFCLSVPALAQDMDTNSPCEFGEDFIKCEAPITNGEFNVDVAVPVPMPITVRRAVLSLPEGEIGLIDQIVITAPDGQRVFGCENIKVSDGTNLIQACGGPAVLQPGPDTTYKAVGSNFGPEKDLTFSVTLSSDF